MRNLKEWRTEAEKIIQELGRIGSLIQCLNSDDLKTCNNAMRLLREQADLIDLSVAALEAQGLVQNCGGCRYEDKTNADLPCRNCLRSGAKPDLYTK